MHRKSPIGVLCMYQPGASCREARACKHSISVGRFVPFWSVSAFHSSSGTIAPISSCVLKRPPRSTAGFSNRPHGLAVNRPLSRASSTRQLQVSLQGPRQAGRSATAFAADFRALEREHLDAGPLEPLSGDGIS